MQTAEPQLPTHGKPLVLIVDDEELILDVMSQMLARLGYQTIVARNGQSAIELFAKAKVRIDLVILDLVLPDMAGTAVFKALKKMAPAIKIILSSGLDTDHYQATKGSGFSGFLQKPFGTRALSALLTDIL